MTKDSEFSVLDGFYILHETIGRGGFAKVKKATHTITGDRVAIKILDKNALGDDLPRVHREIQTLKTLDHPHICKMFQVLETQNKIFIVMEYCRGGELFDYIVQRDRLPEDEARRIFRQIAAAIDYCHKRAIAHRDLKPENILLDSENNVKLIDFGLCAPLKTGLNAKLETCCGSPAYAAPELIRGQRYVGTLIDVWSLGVLLYALLCGSLPFDDPTLGILYRKIQEGKYDEPRWLSEGSKNILRCMLQTNPEFRLPISQLLNHTWCKEGKPEPLPIVSDPGPAVKLALDADVTRVMSANSGTAVNVLENIISEFDYTNHELATYLILFHRKEQLGARNFRVWGINMNRVRTAAALGERVQKSLESEFLECGSVEIIPTTTPARHASMEGGLDDTDLLTMGSPKVHLEPETDDEENKENVDNVDFVKPKVPSPKKHKTSNNVLETPKRLSPARSAECVKTDSLRTPSRYGRTSNNYSPAMPSPSRRKVLGSLERGLDKVRNMLTPRTSKTKKVRTFATSSKGAYNVTTTGSTDPDFVLAQLKASLYEIGIECKEKGNYRLICKSKTVKYELELLIIEELKVVGIRRKRVLGDSMDYKRLMDRVLAIAAGIGSPAPLPKDNEKQKPIRPPPPTSTPVRPPLQTMV